MITICEKHADDFKGECPICTIEELVMENFSLKRYILELEEKIERSGNSSVQV